MNLLGHLPGRLTAEQMGWVLNCQPHVQVLVAARLLDPPLNSLKYFASEN